MDLLNGAVFGQLLKLSVETNTGVVWFELKLYVAIFVKCSWVDTQWQ
jgi:hypothetical protein